jgi:hypothetical protein
VGGIGLEHSLGKSPEVSQDKGLRNYHSTSSTTTMVQNPVHLMQKHPELCQVIDAWTELPNHIKQTIITLVSSVTGLNNHEENK